MKIELICRNHDDDKEISILIEAEEPKTEAAQDVAAEVELSVRTIGGKPLLLGDYKVDAFGVSKMFMENFSHLVAAAKKKGA